MKHLMRKVLAIAMSFCMLMSLTSCISQSSDVEVIDEALRVEAPDFNVLTTTGGEFRLGDHRGQVVVLNFWATWCGPCVREMPAFNQIVSNYGDSVVVCCVNVTEDFATVSEFKLSHQLNFPVGVDSTGQIGHLYTSGSIPFTVIIDKEGRIAQTFTGAADAQTQYEEYSGVIDVLI